MKSKNFCIIAFANLWNFLDTVFRRHNRKVCLSKSDLVFSIKIASPLARNENPKASLPAVGVSGDERHCEE